MKPLTVFFGLSVLACASTPVQPTTTHDSITVNMPDGGVCVMTPPRVDKQALSLNLMPPDSPGGFVIVKCSVLSTGEIKNCRAIKDEAGLADVVAKRLRSMRGTPATCNGEPIDIDYVFNLQFRRPH